MPENKSNQGRFKPGQSGNPGGRPAITKEVREAASEHCVEAIERLVSMMRNSNDGRIVVAAASAILDRAVGKPGQAMELSGPDGAPLSSPIDLSTLSAEALRELQKAANKQGDEA